MQYKSKDIRATSAIALGYISMVLTTVVFAGVFSLIIISKPKLNIVPASFCAQLIACLIGSSICYLFSKNKHSICSAICCLGYLLTLIIFGLFVGDEQGAIKLYIIFAVGIAYLASCALCIKISKKNIARKRGIGKLHKNYR